MGLTASVQRANSRWANIGAGFQPQTMRRDTARLSRFGWLLCFLVFARFGSSAQTIHVDITPEHATNSFRPTEALGAGVDRISRAATDKLFTDAVLKQVLSAGWQTVTYRQNTELHVEAWHWNPQGKWSDAGDKGYFTGNSTPTDFILTPTDIPCHTLGSRILMAIAIRV